MRCTAGSTAGRCRTRSPRWPGCSPRCTMRTATVAVAGLTHGTADPLDLTDERLRADAGVLDGVRLLGNGPLTARLWTAPALAVVGVDAPPVDTAAMMLVPSARARLALRVGPDDDAEQARDALVAHLRSHAPWGAQVEVTAGRVVQPFATRSHGPAHATARAAMTEAWGAAGGRHRRRRLHRLRQHLRPGLSRRGDPRHRRGGPGHPRAWRGREPAHRGVRAGLPRRGAAAAGAGSQR